MFEDLVTALPVIVAALLVWFLRRGRGTGSKQRDLRPAGRRVVVDGSNVMHWGGDPSLKVLKAVLRDLNGRGVTPMVFFDANAGYVLQDRYINEIEFARLLGLPSTAIDVVDSGTPADEVLLAYAAKQRLPVISNDRYREWRVRFPHISKRGALIGGSYRNGAVRWKGRL